MHVLTLQFQDVMMQFNVTKQIKSSFCSLPDEHVCQMQNVRVREDRRHALPPPKLGVGAKNRGKSRETNNRLVAERCRAIDGGTKLGEINCSLHLTGGDKETSDQRGRHSSGERPSFAAHSLVHTHFFFSPSLYVRLKSLQLYLLILNATAIKVVLKFSLQNYPWTSRPQHAHRARSLNQ